jgi:hypothetical protein
MQSSPSFKYSMVFREIQGPLSQMGSFEINVLYQRKLASPDIDDLIKKSSLSRPALRPTQPPEQWDPGSFPRSKALLGRDADHSPSSSAEIKNE